jgi:YVTN family beta-propeller protein
MSSVRRLRANAPIALLAISAGGTAAYVVNSISGTLTPLAAASGKPGAPISVGLYSYPTTAILTGSTAVVLDTYAGQVSLVNTSTRHVYAPITVGNFPVAVAVSG